MKRKKTTPRREWFLHLKKYEDVVISLFPFILMRNYDNLC